MATVGSYIHDKNLKIILFYIVIFFQGFANETFQFTIGRYVSCFGYKPLAEFNAGTSLSSIVVSGLSCAIQAFDKGENKLVLN